MSMTRYHFSLFLKSEFQPCFGTDCEAWHWFAWPDVLWFLYPRSLGSVTWNHLLPYVAALQLTKIFGSKNLQLLICRHVPHTIEVHICQKYLWHCASYGRLCRGKHRIILHRAIKGVVSYLLLICTIPAVQMVYRICANFCIVNPIFFALIYRPMSYLLASTLGFFSWCRFLDVTDGAAVFLDRSSTFTDSSRFSKNDLSWRLFETSLNTAYTFILRCIANSGRPPLSLYGPKSLQLFSHRFPLADLSLSR